MHINELNQIKQYIMLLSIWLILKQANHKISKTALNKLF